MVDRKRTSKAAARTVAMSPVPDETGRRPDVIVEFIFDRGVFSIAVRNIGDRPATKVSVAFDRKIVGMGGAKNVSALPIFGNIEFLGPGREISTVVDTSASYFRREQPTKITAHVTWRDPDEAAYEATITHDLEIYRDLAYLTSH